MISVNPRKPLILGLMKLFFSNVPGCTTYTWIRMVSATRVSLEIYDSFFSEHFRTAVLIIWPDQFSLSFAKHNTFLAVFAFHFYVDVYLLLHICVK